MNYEIGAKTKKGGYNIYSRELEVRKLSTENMDSESYDKNGLLKKEIEYLQSLSGEELLKEKNVILGQVGFLPNEEMDHKKLFMFRTVKDNLGKDWVILKDVFEFNVGFTNFRNLTKRMKDQGMKDPKKKIKVEHIGIERSLSALRPENVLTMLDMPGSIKFKGVIKMMLSKIIKDELACDIPQVVSCNDNPPSISCNKMEIDEPCEEDLDTDSETDTEIDPANYTITLIPDKMEELVQLLANDVYLFNKLGPFIEYKKQNTSVNYK